MGFYPRGRLTTRLHKSIDRGGVAGVFAPSGYGKTVAVDIAFPDRTVVNIPESEANAGAIALALFEEVMPRALSSVRNVLQAPGGHDSWKRLAELTASHFRAAQGTVVLDGLHFVEDPNALLYLERVIERTRHQDGVQWILISRDAPALPISAWVAREFMEMPLTADELAFTPEDAQGVRDSMGVDVSDGDLERMRSDVHGWPLALRLALVAWANGNKQFGTAAIQSRDVLFDLLETELWRDLPDSERLALTISTYLVEVDADLLTRIGIEEAEASLTSLQRRTPLFGQVSDRAFAAHDLLREFVTARHRNDHANLTTPLAQALHASGKSIRAIELYQGAGRSEEAVSVIETDGPAIIAMGERAALIAAIRRLPDALQAVPSVRGLFGWCRLDEGSVDAGEWDMRCALNADGPHDLKVAIATKLISHYASIGKPGEACAVAGTLLSFAQAGTIGELLALASLGMYDAQLGHSRSAREHLQRAEDLLGEHPAERRAAVLVQIAAAHLYLGEFEKARASANRALHLAEPFGLYESAARAYAVLAKIAISGDNVITVAKEMNDRCLRAAELSGDYTLEALALDDTQTIAAMVGDTPSYANAQRRIDELGIRKHYASVGIRILNGAIHNLGNGDTEGADALLNDVDKFDDLVPTDTAVNRAARALLWIARNEPGEAAMLLATMPPAPQGVLTSGIYHDVVQAAAGAFRAIAFWLLSRQEVAEGEVDSLMDRHVPSKMMQIFVQVVHALIHEPRGRLTAKRVAELTEPLSRWGQHGRARFLKRLFVQKKENPLTPTELEVLYRVSLGESADEIAQRLDKSPHTVRTQIKKINAKLDVHSIHRSVAIARREGWIEDPPEANQAS